MLHQDEGGVGGDDGDGVVDDGDDPDEVQPDDDDDGDDFPSPGGNFPDMISLPESSFSLGGFRRVEAAEYFVVDPPQLGFLGGRYTRRGNLGVVPGGLVIARRGPTLGRAQVWRGAHLAPPGASFWLAPASDILRSQNKVRDNWSFADMLT